MVRYISVVFLGLLLIGCQTSPGKLSGRVTFEGESLSGVVVYAYSSPSTELKEEYTAASSPTAKDGTYELLLKKGTYYLVARKRSSLAVTGPLVIGDYEGTYQDNPITFDGKTLKLDDFAVTAVSADRRGEIGVDAGYIAGKVVAKNLSTAYIYVYEANTADKRGPAYEVAKPVNEDGSFKVAVNPGVYQVLVRSRQSGKVRGPIAKDDEVGEAVTKTILVNPNQTITIPEITLKKPDSALWEKVQAGKIKPQTETVIQGQIVDSSKSPVKQVFAFLYAKDQTVGKPLAKSNFTSEDGRYTIYLVAGGTFYLGARSSLGGPLEPGDWVGSYEGNKQSLLTIATGETLDDLTIEVVPFRE